MSADEFEISDEELEELRRRKLLEYQRRLLEEARRRELLRELEARKEAILRRILTPEARSRLSNLKIVRPEMATQLENELIRLAQSGRISIPITDEQLKQILIMIDKQSRRDIRIRRL
ncbi:MAG: DNA-binding protein [Thermoprotei archaeon]|nr:MAG: DNA-binding protein [Thermoprotei archaeon]RLF19205.1 MAG: DNA-binding protein [Thermoprotei archaeon]